MNTETTKEQLKIVRKDKLASTHVRFSKEELQTITQIHKETGETIPNLLKKAFFKVKYPIILMPAEERKIWFKELQAWGNNLNQLAKRVNSGLMEGWCEEIKLIDQKLTAIQAIVVARYGSR